MPVFIANEIDLACRIFLWSGNEEKQQRSLVNWSKVCMGKEVGCLGLRKMETISEAFRIKLAWNMVDQ